MIMLTQLREAIAGIQTNNLIITGMDSEKVIERTLVENIKKLNGMCIKLLCYNIIGLPDRLCLLPGGQIFFVELKTTGKKPRKIQNYLHDKIRALGFKVYIIDTVVGAHELCAEYVNRK